MNAVLVPARSPEDWRRLLAHPQDHWVPGNASDALANAWQHAAYALAGWPTEVKPEAAKSRRAGLPIGARMGAILDFPEFDTWD